MTTTTTLREYLSDLKLMLDNESPTEVVTHCRYILQHFPKNVDTYRLLGQALLHKGHSEGLHDHFVEAHDVFTRVLGVIPDDFVSHLGLSEVYEQEGDLENAIWHLERAYEVAPNNAALQEALLEMLSRHRGEEHGSGKIRLTRGALARQYAKAQLFDQALIELRRALDESPGRVDLEVLLAEVLWASNYLIEAAEASTRLYERLPNCLSANRILASLWLDSRRPTDARPFLERIDALDPYLAADILRQHGQAAAEADPNEIERLDYTASAAATLSSETPDWVQEIGDDLATFDPFAAGPVSMADIMASPEPEAPDVEQSWGFDEPGGQVPGWSLDEMPSGPDEVPAWFSVDRDVPDPMGAAPVPLDDLLDDDETLLGSDASDLADEGEHIPDWFSDVVGDQPSGTQDEGAVGQAGLPDHAAALEAEGDDSGDDTPRGFTGLLQDIQSIRKMSDMAEQMDEDEVDDPDWIAAFEAIDEEAVDASDPAPSAPGIDALSWLDEDAIEADAEAGLYATESQAEPSPSGTSGETLPELSPGDLFAVDDEDPMAWMSDLDQAEQADMEADAVDELDADTLAELEARRQASLPPADFDLSELLGGDFGEAEADEQLAGLEMSWDQPEEKAAIDAGMTDAMLADASDEVGAGAPLQETEDTADVEDDSLDWLLDEEHSQSPDDVLAALQAADAGGDWSPTLETSVGGEADVETFEWLDEDDQEQALPADAEQEAVAESPDLGELEDALAAEALFQGADDDLLAALEAAGDPARDQEPDVESDLSAIWSETEDGEISSPDAPPSSAELPAQHDAAIDFDEELAGWELPEEASEADSSQDDLATSLMAPEAAYDDDLMALFEPQDDELPVPQANEATEHDEWLASLGEASDFPFEDSPADDIRVEDPASLEGLAVEDDEPEAGLEESITFAEVTDVTGDVPAGESSAPDEQPETVAASDDDLAGLSDDDQPVGAAQVGDASAEDLAQEVAESGVEADPVWLSDLEPVGEPAESLQTADEDSVDLPYDPFEAGDPDNVPEYATTVATGILQPDEMPDWMGAFSEDDDIPIDLDEASADYLDDDGAEADIHEPAQAARPLSYDEPSDEELFGPGADASGRDLPDWLAQIAGAEDAQVDEELSHLSQLDASGADQPEEQMVEDDEALSWLEDIGVYDAGDEGSRTSDDMLPGDLADIEQGMPPLDDAYRPGDAWDEPDQDSLEFLPDDRDVFPVSAADEVAQSELGDDSDETSVADHASIFGHDDEVESPVTPAGHDPVALDDLFEHADEWQAADDDFSEQPDQSFAQPAELSDTSEDLTEPAYLTGEDEEPGFTFGDLQPMWLRQRGKVAGPSDSEPEVDSPQDEVPDWLQKALNDEDLDDDDQF